LKLSLARGAPVAFLAIAACTEPGPQTEAERRAEQKQAAVPRAIACDGLDVTTVDIEAGVSASPVGAEAPVGPPLRLRLHDLRAVSPLIAPGRKEKSADRFAGLVPFRVAASGTHTVLVASLAWADLSEADPPRLVEPQSFKWVTVCGKRFKSGLYALESGRAYFVQLWDSPDRELTLMIRRLPGGREAASHRPSLARTKIPSRVLTRSSRRARTTPTTGRARSSAGRSNAACAR